MLTAPLGMASDQKTEVIIPFPNGWDCGSLPPKQKVLKVHYSEKMDCVARGDVGVDRTALRTF